MHKRTSAPDAAQPTDVLDAINRVERYLHQADGILALVGTVDSSTVLPDDALSGASWAARDLIEKARQAALWLSDAVSEGRDSA